MENQGILLYIGIALIILLALWYIWTANNLIAKRNRVKQCRSGICVALKQRNDMIPNLVAAVKSYMGHENETLTRIAELRSRTFQPSQESEQIRTGNELSSLISKLQLSVEDYPELKASEQFTRLQRSPLKIWNCNCKPYAAPIMLRSPTIITPLRCFPLPSWPAGRIIIRKN